MRLLLTTQDFPPDVGGTQTYAAEVVAGLVDAGHAVTVVCPERPGASATDAGRAYRVVRIKASYDAFPFKAFTTVRRLLSRNAFDGAYAISWSAVVPIWLAARTGRTVPVALAVHGRELLLRPMRTRLASWAYNTMRRNMVRHARLLLPVSRYTASLLTPFNVAQETIHVVNNGTNPDVFSPSDGSRIRRELEIGDVPFLLSVCRLVGRKGVDTVLKALPAVLSVRPDIVYVVAGEGPEAGDLKSLAHALGVQDNVRFVGRIPYADLPAFYSAAAMFVLPARQAEPDVEGFGIVFLEANACGTPVIGARAGGVPDAIVDGTTGLLVPPDDPEALARAILDLLGNPERAQAMGRAGRQRVEADLNWPAVSRRIGDLLEHHLSPRHP